MSDLPQPPPPPPGGTWPFVEAAALFLGAWLVLSWPWLSGAVTIPWDAKAHFYPQLQFLAQSIHRGEAPSWTPFVFSGWPQIADPQALIVSPPFAILALLDPDPGFRAADAVVLGMLAFAGLGVILLFRDRLWHPSGALVAALVFAFGASAAWRIQHVGQVLSLAWWPIALWLLARALERRRLGYGFLAGIVAGLMALGRDQVAMLGLWGLAGFVAWHSLAGPGRAARLRASLPPLVLGAIGGALVVTVPLVLTALLAELSNRPGIDYEGAARGSLHPALLLTAWIPNLFGADGPLSRHWGPPSPAWGETGLFLARNMGQLYLGALPIVLLTLGATRGVLWAREIRFFTIAFAVMVLYALGRATPFFAIVFETVPGVALFRRPADAAFLIGGLGAILAGYVAHRWWSETLPAVGRLREAGEAMLLAAPVAIGLALAAAKGTLPLAAWPLITACLFLALGLALFILVPVWAGRVPAGAALVLAGALAFDLAWNNGPNESTALPPQTYDVLRPQSRDPLIAELKRRLHESAGEARLDRVELVGLGFHWPNASLVHRLHNTLGYNPLRLAIYSEATGAGDHVALPEQRRFSALMPSYRSALADLLGLRFIATGVPIERIDPSLRLGDLDLVARIGAAFVYENPRARPRVAFMPRAQPADFGRMLADGRWPEVDLSTTVLLPADAPRRDAPAGSGGGASSARLVSYRNAEVVIAVDAAAPGYVVLADPWHPWWFAELDGRDTPILRANVLFRAVAVPAGRHRLRFTFEPFRGAWRQLEGRWRQRLQGG